MNKISKLSIAPLAAFAVGLAGAAHAQSKPDLKIALMLPYKGVYGELAKAVDNGWQIAIAEVGGAVAGRKVVLVREDTESNPTVSVQKANKVIQSDNVDLMAGVISSGVGVALGQLAGREKKPIILALSVADAITGENCNPYVARTSFSGHAFQYSAGQYWAKTYKTAVTLGPDYAAGHSFLGNPPKFPGGFRKGFEDGGGKVVDQLWSAFQKTKDWGPFLVKAKDSGAQILYSFYGGSESIQVVKQHHDFGLAKNLPLIGDQWLYDELLWDAMGDVVLGTRHVTSHVPELKNPANVAFVAAHAKKFGATPDVNAYLGYENAKATLMAVAALNGDTKDGAKLVKTMASLDYADKMPRGKFSFNKDNNGVVHQLYMVEIAKDAAGKKYKKLVETLPGAADLPGCKMGG
jgi:branched-chain amino acid transport system substrate-binding protein